MMRVIVVGMGVQGQKRSKYSGEDLVACVDPILDSAEYKRVQDVPLGLYDAAILCTPDDPKIGLIKYLLSQGKHVMVEKPLFTSNNVELKILMELAEANNVTCYTAYNHRFEPHFIRMRELIDSGELGRIYSIRLFYGNGTAKLVRDSLWRDQGSGVLPDLGSHLLDTVLDWVGELPLGSFKIHNFKCFENKSPDYVSYGTNSDEKLSLQMEVTLLSWRNHFYADVFAENGSAHIESLCKWGPSNFTVRKRKLPSGRPDEDSITLVQSDPTWKLEYDYFKDLCKTKKNNLKNDLWINSVLHNLESQIKIAPK